MIAYCQGEKEAFLSLYERYETRLRRFFLRRLTTPFSEIANDLFQVTWLKLHQSRDKFNPQQNFATWIFTIALNNLRDHFRSPLATREAEELPAHTEAFAVDPESASIKREEFEKIQEGLAQLTDQQREVLLLSDHEGFPTKEIAKMLAMTDGAVRQLLFRGRNRVRDFLNREWARDGGVSAKRS